jgi:hypothetical protein
MTNHKRTPAGTPAGGEFAEHERSDADLADDFTQAALVDPTDYNELDAMNKLALIEWASERGLLEGVTGARALKKDDLIAAVTEKANSLVRQDAEIAEAVGRPPRSIHELIGDTTPQPPDVTDASAAEMASFEEVYIAGEVPEEMQFEQNDRGSWTAAGHGVKSLPAATRVEALRAWQSAHRRRQRNHQVTATEAGLSLALSNLARPDHGKVSLIRSGQASVTEGDSRVWMIRFDDWHGATRDFPPNKPMVYTIGNTDQLLDRCDDPDFVAQATLDHMDRLVAARKVKPRPGFAPPPVQAETPKKARKPKAA